jgi:hypothetical protein
MGPLVISCCLSCFRVYLVCEDAGKVTDNEKTLLTAAEWKRSLSVLTGAKREEAAKQEIGAEVLKTAIDSHFVRRKDGQCFLNPWDERVAVYKEAIRPGSNKRATSSQAEEPQPPAEIAPPAEERTSST